MKNFFNFIHRHRYDIFYSVILLILISFLFIVVPQKETKNIINVLENKTFDIRQNIIAKNKKVNKDIIIITVDDPSYEYLIEKYGDWPIPRNVYADILDYIQAQNPKYVAFDLLFIKSLNRIQNSDNKLVNGFKNYSNTYTAINFDNFSSSLRTPPVIDKKLKTNLTLNKNRIEPLIFTNCRLILPEIIEVTDKIGHINTPKSDDGFIRKIPLIVQYDNDYYLYMTLKLAIDYLQKYENEKIDIQIDNKNNLVLGKRKIPLTDKAEVILNWYGETGLVNSNTFQYVSLGEVVKSLESKKNGENEILSSDLFKDKIVFIGTSVFSLSDIKTVPTSKYMPGVELHATLLNNIIDNKTIKAGSIAHNIAASLILAFISFLIVFKIRSVYAGVIVFFGFCIFYLYYCIFVMEHFNLWIWTVIPLMISGFVFVCSFIIKYLIKSRDFEYTYKLATTDGLTELYNHRFFQEQLKYKILQAKKQNNNFSLIIIDIDFFKKFNDTYGHQAGDAVLKYTAKTIKSCVRNEDFVCRYGGEEMTVILNNTNHEIAVNIAKKICSTIAGKKFELSPEIEVNITISLGVATYPQNGEVSAALIEYADKCLYMAKENGRNQVGFIE